MISFRKKLEAKSPEFQQKVRELKAEMTADYGECSRAGDGLKKKSKRREESGATAVRKSPHSNARRE